MINHPNWKKRQCKSKVKSIYSSFFFHNSRLNSWIQQNKIYNKFIDLIRDWTQIACLVFSHFKHYSLSATLNITLECFLWLDKNHFILKKLELALINRPGSTSCAF